jgi:REP element-mobilizing transposase RayT
MQRGPEGTKYCHLVWATRNGQSRFKIAATAPFCEHAVHHACAAMGWRPELTAVLPDRVHILVAVPSEVERRVPTQYARSHRAALTTSAVWGST